MNPNLSPQQFSHEQLGALNASDYKGTVAEGVAPMQRWQDMFGGTGEARHYDEGSSPQHEVERLRGDIRQHGVQEPITVVDYGPEGGLGMRIKDGHHRAVAAHLEGKGAPVEVLTSDQYVRRLWGNR